MNSASASTRVYQSPSWQTFGQTAGQTLGKGHLVKGIVVEAVVMPLPTRTGAMIKKVGKTCQNFDC